jgi:hypothetical protein
MDFLCVCRCAGEPGNQSQNFFEFKATAKKKNSADAFALCTDTGKDHDISTCLNSDGMRSWRLKLASILVAHLAQLGFVQGASCYPLQNASTVYTLSVNHVSSLLMIDSVERRLPVSNQIPTPQL